MFLRRVCLLLLDSLGIGESLDANKYNDQGSNTFGNIHIACSSGKADLLGVRSGKLNIPNLSKLGIYHAAVASSGIDLIDLSTLNKPLGYYGYAVEKSFGKDTPSGHWEITGVPTISPWGYFPNTIPCFPKDLISDFIKHGNLPGVLGQKHSSGTEIIEEFGEEHLRTGKPIIYTSDDSIFQIAAHEDIFNIKQLYDICKIAKILVDKYNISRVVARPFSGNPGSFFRTENRRDYISEPPESTLLDVLKAENREVIAIGKVGDIYSNRGCTKIIKKKNDMMLFDATLNAIKSASYGSLIFTNFVDFDSVYGHRRNVAGYANALELFDSRLPELFSVLREDDLVFIVSDHGCDPTFSGFGHTREHIPILGFGPRISSNFIGRRDTFADIGQSIAEYLNVGPLMHGISFI
ncbi:phosphopentomutase [Candidatus Legionella polyplacis]|uniref:Phosphopentomutase n=1 Tax=Candidatus Legionella polyplacis TaxID=2005262 RepID=A0ABZ2H036_9GAMM